MEDAQAEGIAPVSATSTAAGVARPETHHYHQLCSASQAAREPKEGSEGETSRQAQV